ncbi:MAG: AmmeMemoRadiSam system radical SAM enzyme [Myxococcota bacterium]|nr:AmmeMemoRadiSam system radical SAM enzyme [Myxococcota bacterium]
MNDREHPARYWRKDESGRVVCELCPRDCALNEGQRGLCFVRMRRDDRLVLTTWGRSTGFCIDPIEKKPLNHFLPGTPVLSFGTAGCNLACRFCQNWSISKSREVDDLSSQAGPLDLAQAARRHGCRSVAYTYNDPVAWLEYAVDVARACRDQGIHNVAVTAGFVNEEPRKEFFSEMDAANVDLKAFTDRFYWKVCGGRLQAVLDTLLWLRNETDVWFEITNLVIPGENDSDEELDAMTRWVVAELGPDVPMHFSAFHPDWKMMDTPRTPPETLSRARTIARHNGVRHAYTGNVHDRQGDTSSCSNCGGTLIVRDWYEILQWRLGEAGECLDCGTRLPGVFEAQPGRWGRKRQRLSLPVLS